VLVPGGEKDPEYQARMSAFNDALRRHGWIVGSNVNIDYRWAAGYSRRMDAAASELNQLAPDVILTNGLERPRLSNGTTARFLLYSQSCPTRSEMVSSAALRSRAET
jgi:hypothetical protein